MSDQYIKSTLTDTPAYKMIDSTQECPSTYLAVGQPVYGNKPLLRVGFKSPFPKRHLDNPHYVHDIRPIYWPYYHPFYLTATAEDHYVVMAYVEKLEDVTAAWPEATDIEVFDDHVTVYQYTDRFPEPDWIRELHDHEVTPVTRIGCFSITERESGITLVGASEDMDYAVNLTVHQLEYGTCEDADLQDCYDGPESIDIIFRETTTMDAATKLAKSIRSFNDFGDTVEP